MWARGVGRECGRPLHPCTLRAAPAARRACSGLRWVLALPLQKDLMVLNEVYTVMATDALTTSHPLSFDEDEINTPAQISEVFDSIAYSKVGV